MSLQHAAKHIAAKGRNGDSVVVHMTPQEVAGLQALAKAHGTTLTINPETGMPEAFSLQSLLPSLAGAALSFVPGVGPLMAAGIVGGGTALATGSLNRGLMAGLGAFGGAGLAGSITGAGANAAASELAGATQTAAAPLGEGANAADILRARSAMPAGPMMSALNAAPTQSATSMELAKQGLKSFADNPSALLTKDNLKYGLAALTPAMMAGQKQTPYNAGSDKPMDFSFSPGRTNVRPSGRDEEQTYFNPSYTRMAEGGEVDEGPEYVYDPVLQKYTQRAKSIADPGVLRNAVYKSEGSDAVQVDPNPAWSNMSNQEKAAYYAANPTMAAITQAGQKAFGYTMPGMIQAALVPDFVREQSLIAYGINPGEVGVPVSAAGTEVTGPGTIGSRDTRGSNEAPPSTTPSEGSGTTGSNSDYGYGSEGAATGADMDAAFARGGLMALARGGVSHLGDYSDGDRLLRGPGDGVSDSIPATIGDKRPARLADGEFVVPARIVSELGNGSTEAGARKLYAMMDRIQKARSKTVGKDRVATNSRAEKYLPA